MKGREGVRNLRAQIFLLFYALLRHKKVLCLYSVAYPPAPSQQLDEETPLFLGASRKSPYLCISKKIHALI